MSKLKEPRKVDNQNLVRGECYYPTRVEPFDNMEGLTVNSIERLNGNMAYYYEIECENEDTAHSLANFLRYLRL